MHKSLVKKLQIYLQMVVLQLLTIQIAISSLSNICDMGIDRTCISGLRKVFTIQIVIPPFGGIFGVFFTSLGWLQIGYVSN